MQYQLTFTDFEYHNRKKKTRREEFLNMMDGIIPWSDWISIIEPYYPSGKRGRPVMGIETMLRMYLLQIWFCLSDAMTEDSIYDSYAMKKFMKIDFDSSQAPDATTLLKFRHLLEKHGLCKALFDDLNRRLDEKGCLVRGGTIVDATIIRAPSSTKNASGKRDPEMRSTQKGGQYYFGAKVHIGVDAFSGYAHTATMTAANAHDVTQTAKLLRDDDEVVYGDSGYIGAEKREEIKSDARKSKIEFRINRRPGKLRDAMESSGKEWDRRIEGRKSSVRGKVEHIFRIMKVQFGYTKTAYRGIAKNLNRVYALLFSANAYMLARSCH